MGNCHVTTVYGFTGKLVRLPTKCLIGHLVLETFPYSQIPKDRARDLFILICRIIGKPNTYWLIFLSYVTDILYKIWAEYATLL